MAELFEKSVQLLVDEKTIPNAIFYASDANGIFYQRSFGSLSFGPGAQTVSEDTYLWAASCTKLLASLSVMKLVEDGRLGLDDRVDAVLPELAELKIITQIEPAPEFRTPENKITYRQLLTNTSGLGYDFINPLLVKWREQNPRMAGPVPVRFNTPLLFEPGTSWAYGSGFDWAGLAVERVSGMSLAEFMQENIFTPVGIEEEAITFFPWKIPGARLATMAQRTGRDSFVVGNQGTPDPNGIEHCFGGQGTYFRGGDYVAVLRALLADDETLLQRATVAELFRPQLNAVQKEGLNKFIYSSPGLVRVMARDVEQGKLDHCLAGVVDQEGIAGRRGKGTIMWGGAPNLSWHVDRENGICGMMQAQLLPSGDAVYRHIYENFERTMYQMAAKVTSGV